MFILFLLPQITFAQNLTITGQIIDKKTGEPVGYAHVGIPERGIGTVSSFSGDFILRIPEYYANSELVVSFIGYSNYRKPISQINGPLTIYLEQSTTTLAEVVVMDEKRIEDIVRRAVREIPNNYPTKPTNQVGFYRESKTVNPNDYAYLAEGVLDIYKTSYKNDKEGQTALDEGRQVALIPVDELESTTTFSSGHLAAHRFDFVKNREDFIQEKNFDAYKYYIAGITSYNDRPVYVIGFDQEDGHPDGRMRGLMYIDTLSYAFLRAEFEITEYGQKKVNDYPLYVGRWKGNKYVVNYRNVNGKWQFSSALREGEWRDGGLYSNEILITDFDPDRGKQLPYLDRMNRNVPFRRLTGDYDPDFWSNYNIAPLSSGLQESVNQQRTAEIASSVFDSTFMATLQERQDSSLEARVTEVIERQEDARENPITIVNPTRPGFRLSRFQTTFGASAHMLNSGIDNISLNFLEASTLDPIVQLEGPIDPWRFEYLLDMDFRFLINKNLFVRYGLSRNFYTTIYRENSLGIGTQLNLSKQRPFFFKLSASYSRLRFARKLGQATNEFGEFKADKKKFKSEKVNMYYGAQSHNLKASAELSLELHPGMELFLRASYLLPFAENAHMYLWERKRFFRKRARLPLDESPVQVFSNDDEFNGRIYDQQSFIFTIGVLFK